MSTALRPVITNAGITALIDARNRGVKAKITHVAVGDGVAGDGNGPYTAANDMTALKHEIQRTVVAGGELLGNLQNQLHLTATVQDQGENVPEVYPIYEIGFFLETGILFAIYASPDEKLAEKVAGTDFVLAFDLTLTGTDAGDVVVDGSGQLEMPIARDNLLMGENTVKIHTQAEFDRIFNQGENTAIPANTTIVLNPIQNTTPVPASEDEQDEIDTANGASGGVGDSAHNTYNGRPAYILKNSIQVNSNINIIGFNHEDTIVVKGSADAKFKIIGESGSLITGVRFSGWSFDGRGGVNSLGGNFIASENGGAIFLEFTAQCEFDCKIINHKTEGSGGGVFAGAEVLRIRASNLHQNSAISGGGVFGCDQSFLTAYDCQASGGGSGIFGSTNSEVRVFNCDVENCVGGTSYQGNSISYLRANESLLAEGSIDLQGSLSIRADSSSPFTLVATDDNHPVGITQENFGGSATMELTTADASGSQASRLCIRGKTDSANIEFLKGARGSETVNMCIKGETGHVGIGTDDPKAPLDVNGGIRINGEKPFLFKRYQSIKHRTKFDTGKSTSKYLATVAGFRSVSGDFDEKGPRNDELVTVQMMEHNGKWAVFADIKTHGSHETWAVNVLFINRQLVEFE